jgi:hypothetical protein
MDNFRIVVRHVLVQKLQSSKESIFHVHTLSYRLVHPSIFYQKSVSLYSRMKGKIKMEYFVIAAAFILF